MDLIDGLRTTGAIREFQDRPVERETIARILDTARFAPNGGNQQSWRVVIVEEPALRAGMRDLYVPVWLEYLEQRKAGIQPWAPIGDRTAETAAVEQARELSPEDAPSAAGDFATNFDQVPVMAVVLADLRLLAATDRDLGRYTLIGGASVYPFVWSILLAAHAEGLGGVITTMATAREPEVHALLSIPAEFAVAAVLALGHPVHRPTRLCRDPVDTFATLDSFDGMPLDGP